MPLTADPRSAGEKSGALAKSPGSEWSSQGLQKMKNDEPLERLRRCNRHARNLAWVYKHQRRMIKRGDTARYFRAAHLLEALESYPVDWRMPR
jgi:hypothetical protein